MAPKISAANERYRATRLRYSGDRLEDSDGNAVMMRWEGGIMRATARALCFPGARILNLGFGMGLFDTEVQRHRPAAHHIVEPHPDVQRKLRADGWTKKRGVTVHFGFWQQVIDDLPRFDAIYFDTWEDSVDQFGLLAKRMPKLLAPGGCFSWFNHPEQRGMIRQVRDAGLTIERKRIRIKPPSAKRQGTLYYFDSEASHYDIIMGRLA